MKWSAAVSGCDQGLITISVTIRLAMRITITVTERVAIKATIR